MCSFSVSEDSVFQNMASMAQCEVLHSLIMQLSGLTVDYDHVKRLKALAVEPLGNGRAKRILDIRSGWVITKRGKKCTISKKEESKKEERS